MTFKKTFKPGDLIHVLDTVNVHLPRFRIGKKREVFTVLGWKKSHQLPTVDGLNYLEVLNSDGVIEGIGFDLTYEDPLDYFWS